MKKIDDYYRLIKEAEKTKSERDQAKGQFDQLMKQLKSEFDCKSLDDAKKLLKRLSKEEVKLEQQVEKGIKKLQSVLDRRSQ